MIIIAIVRVASSTLPGDVTDTSWLFFWQTLEAATAVTMVVITSFRSLFESDSTTTTKHSAGYVYSDSDDARAHASIRIRDRYDKLNELGDDLQTTVRTPKLNSQGGSDNELDNLNRLSKNIRITKELSQTSSYRESVV